MSEPSGKRVTDLLNRAADGDDAARGDLYLAVYSVLHGAAERVFSSEPTGHTLQATAIVDDAFCQVVGSRDRWESRREFYAVAAAAMRKILVSYARGRRAEKRGGSWNREPTDLNLLSEKKSEVDLITLDEALNRLEDARPGASAIVEQRFFCGLSNLEVSKVLGRGLRTIEAEWAFARAWLRRELSADGD